jgi:dihydropyrimidinase
MAMFAAIAGEAPIYFVHLSAAQSLEIIRKARDRGRKNIFAETCPQYLILDESMYLREDGLKYIMSPPLRAEKDREALWEGVCGSDIDVIGTDHCPFFFGREKQLGKDDFTLAPGGIPGVETRMMLLNSRVAAGELDMGRLVSLCCAEPARLFGLYPKKGAIAVGSDADFVIFDPAIKKRLTFDMLHENTDYTPYEGMSLAGYPVMTISRGEIIAENGRFTGEKGRGRFLIRGLPDLQRARATVYG